MDQQVQTGDWIVFSLKSIGFNVEMRSQDNDKGPKKVGWATFEAPQGYEIRIAHQLRPGAGPMPACTLPMMSVSDMVETLITEFESGIAASYNKPVETPTQTKGW